MKKILCLGCILLLTGLNLYARDNIAYVPVGSLYSAEPINSRVTVTSSTVTTIAVLDLGVQRIIQNIGVNDAYITKQSSATIATDGWKLLHGQTYIESLYFGEIYILAIGGDTTIAIEEIRKAF